MRRLRTRLGLIAMAAVLSAVLAACSGGDSGNDPAAFCRQLTRLGGQVTSAAEGPKEMADVPAARRLADDIATTADSLRQTAPEEIAEDAERLASVTADLARDLRDFYQAIIDDPARANDPTFLASFEPLTEERRGIIAEAGAKVRPWVEKHCDGTSPASTTTSAAALAPTNRIRTLPGV